MIKVLTIRDPKTGALIIEEQIQPHEARDAALARIYRKTLGPEAPEFMVMTKSIWPDDRDWAAELGKDWGDFGLALLGPTGDPKPEQARTLLWRVSETEQSSKMKLPMWKENIDKVRNGELLNIIIPVKPRKPPDVGDKVTFLEAKPDPYGESILVSDGDSVSVYLTQVTNRGQKWFGFDIYSIAWDPPDPPRARTRSKRSATHGSR